MLSNALERSGELTEHPDEESRSGDLPDLERLLSARELARSRSGAHDAGRPADVHTAAGDRRQQLRRAAGAADRELSDGFVADLHVEDDAVGAEVRREKGRGERDRGQQTETAPHDFSLSWVAAGTPGGLRGRRRATH